MNKLLLVLALLLLAGCEGIKVQKKYQGGVIYVPTLEFKESEVRSQAEKECQVQNMRLNRLEVTDTGRPADNTALGYKYFNYFCDPATPINQQSYKQESPINTQDTLTIDPPKKQKIEINEAKAQCLDIGFKPGTENFGKCVLELTK
jgi:hypothetical protein